MRVRWQILMALDNKTAMKWWNTISFFFSYCTLGAWESMRNSAPSYNACLQIVKVGKQVPLCWCLDVMLHRWRKLTDDVKIPWEIKSKWVFLFFTAIRWHYQHNCVANVTDTACVYVKYEYGYAQIKNSKRAHISACECIYIKNVITWKQMKSSLLWDRLAQNQSCTN